MNKRIFVMAALALALFMGGCVKKDPDIYYREWHVSWLTPKGTHLVGIIGELYKPIHQATNKQIGLLVTEYNGIPIMQYPISQKTVTGEWVVIDNGYDKDMMLSNYYMLPDIRKDINVN